MRRDTCGPGGQRGAPKRRVNGNRSFGQHAWLVFGILLFVAPPSNYSESPIPLTLGPPRAATPATAHFDLARALYRAGQFEQSLSELEQSEKTQEPTTLRPLYRAMNYGRMKDWGKSVQLLQPFVLEHPKIEEGWYWLGAGQFHQRLFVAAENSIMRALALNPKDGDAYRVRGLVDLELGRRNEAFHAWMTAAQLNPADFETTYLLGRLFYDANHFTEAARWLRKTRVIAPHHFRASYFLGLTEEALGNLTDALKLYRQSVADSQTQKTPYSWAYASLGRLLTKTGHGEEAAVVLEEASRLTPDARVFTALGELEFQQRKLDAARYSLRRAISLDPTFADPHYALGRVLTAMHLAQQAQVEISNFQRLKSAGAARFREGQESPAESPSEP